jgi:adenosylcobinamide-GDP ribazoletransferase
MADDKASPKKPRRGDAAAKPKAARAKRPRPKSEEAEALFDAALDPRTADDMGDDSGNAGDDAFAKLMAEWGREVRTAIFLLTGMRAPEATPITEEAAALSRRVFPVVALLMGIGSFAVYWTMQSIHQSGLVSATCAIGFLVLITGARTEIGLAHVADGLNRGKDPESRRIAVEAHHVGYGGFLAILFALGIKISILAAAPPKEAAILILAAVVFSRSAMVLATIAGEPAGDDTAGGLLRDEGKEHLWIVVLLGAAIACLAIGTWSALIVAGAAFLATGAGVWLARELLGGLTAPALAAIVQLVEVVVIAVAVARL